MDGLIVRSGPPIGKQPKAWRTLLHQCCNLNKRNARFAQEKDDDDESADVDTSSYVSSDSSDDSGEWLHFKPMQDDDDDGIMSISSISSSSDVDGDDWIHDDSLEQWCYESYSARCDGDDDLRTVSISSNIFMRRDANNGAAAMIRVYNDDSSTCSGEPYGVDTSSRNQTICA